MANTANTNLKTITQRNSKALAIQATPHCETVGDARVLGFVKKGINVPGIWIVREEKGRTATGAPIRVRAKLGLSCILADEADANPAAGVLSYEQARLAAINHVFGDKNTAPARTVTVLEAVIAHRDYGGKKGRKLDENKLRAFNNLRFNVLRLESDGKEGVTGAKRDNLGIGHIAINALTTEQLVALRQVWIDENGEPTALRNWSNLHSCLERAASVKANGITNDAWRTEEHGGEMPSIEQDFEGRLVHFSNADALAIIEHARSVDALVGDYLEALFRTGARPGKEVFTLAAGDFNPALRHISIRAGKTGPRPQVALDAHGVALFTRLTAGCASNVRIFADLQGDPRRIKAALLAAVQAVNPLLPEGVEQKEVVAYAFRHTFISRRLEAGAHVSMIAKHCGNSIYIIENTYAQFCPSEMAAMINATAPQPVLRVVSVAA